MTNPTEEQTEETHYVSFDEFGAVIAAELNGEKGNFQKKRVRNVILYSDDIGRDEFDRTLINGEPRIALTRSNIEMFLDVFPSWEVDADKRKQIPPVERPSDGYQAEPFFPDSRGSRPTNYYRRR